MIQAPKNLIFRSQNNYLISLIFVFNKQTPLGKHFGCFFFKIQQSYFELHAKLYMERVRLHIQAMQVYELANSHAEAYACVAYS